MSASEIIKLLGVNAVLLPIAFKSKAPRLKGWQKLAFEQTQNSKYQAKLESHGNTGVLLGQASENLISIDFDDDQALGTFLENNPSLSHTLTTKGARGCNLWFVIKGDYPSSHKLFATSGEGVGEWRAQGNQTVISGTHPSGCQYSIINHSSPLFIEYSSIDWGVIQMNTNDIKHTKNIKNRKEGIKKEGKPLDAGTTFLEKITSAEKYKTELKRNKPLNKLYTRFIQNKIPAQQGERNSQLVAMTAFLFRNTSEEIAVKLGEYFYLTNQDIFTDSYFQHKEELDAQLRNTKERWYDELSEAERIITDGFPENPLKQQREMFRIMRQLAYIETEGNPIGEFYLSCAELGRRLGIDQNSAYRLLKQFIGLSIISIIEKGTQYAKSATVKATVFRWLL